MGEELQRRSTDAVDRGRGRVLLVDDVAANIRVLARLLAPEFEVLAATRADEALRLADQRRPDLILLDVEMPDMDGYALCTALQQNPRTAAIPVIFVTARQDEEDEVRGLRLGAVDYITKPYSEAIVRARVRTHMELKRYRDLLQNRSYIDGLTGVANRRRFDDFLAQTLREGAGSTALLLLDVDHFKAYNDALGHLAGDECLKRVAQELSHCVRHDCDLLARYGGEEFAFVLPGADRAAALAVAERVRERLAILALPHPASAVSAVVTVSIGGATTPTGERIEASALVERADRALYRAKSAGRDRVLLDCI